MIQDSSSKPDVAERALAGWRFPPRVDLLPSASGRHLPCPLVQSLEDHTFMRMDEIFFAVTRRMREDCHRLFQTSSKIRMANGDESVDGTLTS
jgi:hypothetical protein